MLNILEPVVFQATTLERSGKTVGAELTYRTNAYDRNPRVVTLTVAHALAGNSRLPFSYQYTEPTLDRRWAEILIIAGPGVSIKLKNFPNSYIASEIMPIVQILRVQDPGAVPPLAADFVTSDFLTSFDVNAENPSINIQDILSGEPADNYFQVTRGNSVFVVRHIYSNMELILSVPEFSSDGSGGDAEARFAYYFDPDGKLGYLSKPLLTVVKTPAVKVSVSDSIFEDTMRASLRGRTYNLKKISIPWNVFETERLDEIPRQGIPITVNPAWNQVLKFDRTPSLAETAAEVAFDMALGMIPGVGNAICLAEFVYGLYSGHDKWGRKLGTGDLVLLGIGALLPFMARLRPVTLISRFGSRLRNAESLAADLKAAHLSSDESRLVTEAVKAIQKGERPTQEAYQAAAKLFARLEKEVAPVEDILNAEKSGFAHPDLQEYFEAYKARTKRAISPQEWIRVTQSKRAQSLLSGLLGKDYARKAVTALSRRVVNIMEIPRSPAMTQELAKELLGRLGKNQTQVLERMDSFLAELRTAEDSVRQALLRKMGTGYFNILKGNIGEVLSREKQLAILADIAKKNPGAKIYRGVKVQLMSGGKLGQELLFSDNIVAIQRGGNLEILGVMEVKAGFKGHAEGTAQIFEWLEGRLDEGSHLVIPDSARTIAANGVEGIAKRGAFVYSPGSKSTGQVKMLFSADRHLFVADGVSHVGIDSGLHVAPNASSHSLGISSADIDWLVGQVLMGLSP